MEKRLIRAKKKQLKILAHAIEIGDERLRAKTVKKLASTLKQLSKFNVKIIVDDVEEQVVEKLSFIEKVKNFFKNMFK